MITIKLDAREVRRVVSALRTAAVHYRADADNIEAVNSRLAGTFRQMAEGAVALIEKFEAAEDAQT